ncbi:MAG TPA: CsoS2 family carboxysome shell protein [Acidimicrobiales bacterium]|nr:CsoS2 family carboxysome shell protein [Acidimicrobiales bacterium]
MYAVQTADSADLAELRHGARDGVAAARARRRQMSQGKQALTGAGPPPGAENLAVKNGAGAPAAAPNGQGPPNGAQGAPGGAKVATDAVADAHLGRTLSQERRRQMSQGKQALTAGAGRTAAAAGVGAPPTAPNGQGALSDAKRAPSGAKVATDAVADAHLGRTLSKERRRQMSQGKQALTAGAGQTAAAAGVGAPPAAEGTHLNGAVPGRQQAQARRAEASRFGSAGMSGPQREGRVTHPPKVIVSPTHGGQQVTGLRIGPGLRVTGDEAGAALPVSGSQYVAADGPPPAPGAGRKVGLARTAKGGVVSGTTVRNKVAVTGDDFGEHISITGEADQKLDDDLTPRSDGTYRPAQFPRRADPHGASAVGTSLMPKPGMVGSDGDGPWHPLETTDGGWAVTGTAVGRSGRVTGNEAGACRPITGAQYQGLSSYSTECAGTGGGTAPAAHLNRARLDPATGGKVSVARTWGGQDVTGPSVEHRSNVTGDEPGIWRPMTGTPYHGPSTTPDEGDFGAQRRESRAEGVAVTGDVPMQAQAVTGTERGNGRDVTGTSYYRDMRPAEPAADDWAGAQAFPVALARRLAGGKSDDAATQETGDAAPPASSVPGSITGSFAVGEGMVTGNNEFMFRPRANREAEQREVTGEGRTDGRTITGAAAAWTAHDVVTGTEGYIAAGRNPTERGGKPHGWAGAVKFQALATPGGPRQTQNVTGLSGWSQKAAARVTLSGGAQG